MRTHPEERNWGNSETAGTAPPGGLQDERKGRKGTDSAPARDVREGRNETVFQSEIKKWHPAVTKPTSAHFGCSSTLCKRAALSLDTGRKMQLFGIGNGEGWGGAQQESKCLLLMLSWQELMSACGTCKIVSTIPMPAET